MGSITFTLVNISQPISIEKGLTEMVMIFLICGKLFLDYPKGVNYIMGKKHRAQSNRPKKNNHIPAEAIVAEHEAHAKENNADGGRKTRG